ncbi:MAG: helix-turn-helix domain-containing protein [Acidobacteriota bacterium]
MAQDAIRAFETSYGQVPGPEHRGRPIVALLFPGIELLDFAGPSEVFHLANLAANQRTPGAGYQYQLRCLSLGETLRIPTTAGIELVAHGVAEEHDGEIDTLLIPGGAISSVIADEDTIAVVKRLAIRARRVASVCSGAFILAATGLLNGRRATTHWRGCRLLAERFPETRVELDSIFVQDGPFYTSAGSTAGIDLSLHLVEADLGPAVSMHVAKDMVVFLKRQGGQAQFSTTLGGQAADSSPLRDLLAWIPDHLSDDLRVESLAARAHMSLRNFVRRFPEEVGMTPARYVEQVRVEAAKRRLEVTSRSLDEVATDCGFGSADSMRRCFLRVLGVLPGAYRERFSTGFSRPSAGADGLEH